VPLAHETHSDCPNILLYFPTGHNWQSENEELPALLLNVPVGHKMQEDCELIGL